MRKSTRIEVHEYMEPDGMSSIWWTNIGLYPEKIQKCSRIIKEFIKGNEVFFGHYRIDGLNLTDKEMEQCSKEIPAYFLKNGRYEPLITRVKKRKKEKIYSGYFTIGSLPVDKITIEMLPKIFHYYLETICFSPKIDWTTFEESYHNYMEDGARNYIAKGFTDFLFAYSDSGDFSISFDPKQHDKNMVYRVIQEILEGG